MTTHIAPSHPRALDQAVLRVITPALMAGLMLAASGAASAGTVTIENTTPQTYTTSDGSSNAAWEVTEGSPEDWEVEDDVVVSNISTIINSVDAKSISPIYSSDGIRVTAEEMKQGTTVSLTNTGLVSATGMPKGTVSDHSYPHSTNALHLQNGTTTKGGLAGAALMNRGTLQAPNDAAIWLENNIEDATHVVADPLLSAGDITITNTGRITNSQSGIRVSSSFTSDKVAMSGAKAGSITINSGASIAVANPVTSVNSSSAGISVLVKDKTIVANNGNQVQVGDVTVNHTTGSITARAGATTGNREPAGIFVDVQNAVSDVSVNTSSSSSLITSAGNTTTGFVDEAGIWVRQDAAWRTPPPTPPTIAPFSGAVTVNNKMPMSIGMLSGGDIEDLSSAAANVSGVFLSGFSPSVSVTNAADLNIYSKGTRSRLVGIGIANSHQYNNVNVTHTAGVINLKADGLISFVAGINKGAGIFIESVSPGFVVITTPSLSQNANIAVASQGDITIDKNIPLPAIYVDPTNKSGAGYDAFNANTTIVLGGYDTSDEVSMRTSKLATIQGGDTKNKARAAIEVLSNYEYNSGNKKGVTTGLTKVLNGGDITAASNIIFSFVPAGYNGADPATAKLGVRDDSILIFRNAQDASMTGAIYTGIGTSQTVDQIYNAGTWHLNNQKSVFLAPSAVAGKDEGFGYSDVINTGTMTIIGTKSQLTANAIGAVQANDVLTVINDGLIDLSYDTDEGATNVFTIGTENDALANYYTNGGGKIRLDVKLGDDSSSADLVEIYGNISGSAPTILDVRNLGGAGDLTKDGIVLVRTTSTNKNAFTLQGGSIAINGYRYVLDVIDGNTTVSAANQNKFLWVLKSTEGESVPVMGWAGLVGMGTVLAALAAIRRRKAA